MANKVYAPGPTSFFPGRHVYSMLRDPVDFLMQLAQEYGDVVHFKLGPQHVFLVNNPDYIKDVLVTNHCNFLKGRVLQRMKRLLGEGLLTSETELHTRQRRLVQPAFYHERLQSYSQVMTDYAEQLQAERWQEGEILDISSEMMRLTLRIVGKTMFGAETDSVVQQVSEAISTLVHLFNTLRLPYSEWFEKLPLPSLRRFDAARNQLDSIINEIITNRRSKASDQGDLLSMLMAAQDVEGDGNGMSDLQLRDEVLTIFLAGHETMSNALTWAWYLLSQNQEVEANLHAELDGVLSNRVPRLEDIPNLKYTGMIFKETLRLYPPAWTVNRTVIKDYKLGPYVIPASSVILMSQYVTHHDSRYFPKPFSFAPERWMAPDPKPGLQYCYFPFGGGPRRCIGDGFAMMEGILLLAVLARSWRLRPVSDRPVVLEPLITLRPKNGMPMRLEKR